MHNNQEKPDPKEEASPLMLPAIFQSPPKLPVSPPEFIAEIQSGDFSGWTVEVGSGKVAEVLDIVNKNHPTDNDDKEKEL